MTQQSTIRARHGLSRRKLLCAALAVAAMAGPLQAAQAEDFPSKPIKLIVPFAAGGGNDGIARLLGQLLSDDLKQPVVVENRPGAGGTLLRSVAYFPAASITGQVAVLLGWIAVGAALLTLGMVRGRRADSAGDTVPA